MFLPKYQVVEIVSEAVLRRAVLAVKYQHTRDGEVVDHVIAPFDIGSSNPHNAQKFSNNLYAYSYTRISEKTGLSDPKVVTFSISHFIQMQPNDETFDETDLCIKNMEASPRRFDYRTYRFALLPERDWFRS